MTAPPPDPPPADDARPAGDPAATATAASPGVSPLPAEAVARLSGLALLRAMIAGRLPAPPLPTALGFRLVAVEEGRARFEGTPDARCLNPLGTVHGGWTASILDSALGCAIQTTLAAGEIYTTLEFKVNLVRPLSAGAGPVVAEGRIRHRGGRTATSEADLLGVDGRLAAHASCTCLLMPAPTPGG